MPTKTWACHPGYLDTYTVNRVGVQGRLWASIHSISSGLL